MRHTHNAPTLTMCAHYSQCAHTLTVRSQCAHTCARDKTQNISIAMPILMRGAQHITAGGICAHAALANHSHHVAPACHQARARGVDAARLDRAAARLKKLQPTGATKEELVACTWDKVGELRG